MKKNFWLILGIFIFGIFLRIFKLGQNPPSLYWDEVSLGYNAYSILKTAKDEFGNFLPIDKFIAFGDYKPVGYIYATIPSVFLFGLNEFAVRLPSALAGSLMVLVTYFLVKELFSKKIGLIAAFLLAVSPWSLHLSRAAFEANLAAFFNLLGFFFFIKGVKHKTIWLFFSVIFFIFSFYTFNSNRILAPLFLILLILIFHSELWQRKKWLFLSLFLGFLMILPILPYLQSRESKLRFYEVNIFSDLGVILSSNERIAIDGQTRLAKIIHHRYLGYLENFLKHYFDHFQGNFLFIEGDVNPRLSVRSIGELYLIELPFFLIGCYLLLSNLRNKNYLLIFLWFLMTPLPAATARETPHALRIVSILPTPQIISALGIYSVYRFFKNKKITFLWVFLTLFLVNFGYYIYQYYEVFPKKYSGDWLDGYQQAVAYVQKNLNKYDKIYITNSYNRPYIYFLFYLKYAPEKYWQTVVRERDWFGNWTVYAFDKFEFSDGPFSANEKKILYLGPTQVNLSEGIKIDEIKRKNGEIAFWAWEKIN